MTKDDAKYREWWEKLKGEMLRESLPGNEDGILAQAAGRSVFGRMLQIEEEEKKRGNV